MKYINFNIIKILKNKRKKTKIKYKQGKGWNFPIPAPLNFLNETILEIVINKRGRVGMRLLRYHP